MYYQRRYIITQPIGNKDFTSSRLILNATNNLLWIYILRIKSCQTARMYFSDFDTLFSDRTTYSNNITISIDYHFHKLLIGILGKVFIDADKHINSK